MKKNFIYSLFAMAALLFATSCQNEDLFGGANVDTDVVTYSITTQDLGTRAEDAGRGKYADKLYYGVYEFVDNDNDNEKEWSLVKKISATTLEGSEKQPITIKNSHAIVNIQLAKQKQYSIIFWAQNDEKNMVDIDWENRSMSLTKKSKLLANQETYDAFWAYDKINLKGALDKKVSLVRPFAQINIGASDFKAVEDASVIIEKSAIVVKNVPTTMDLATGEVTDYTESSSVSLGLDSILDHTKWSFPNAGCEFLTLGYILAEAEQTLVDIDLTYTDDEGGNYSNAFTNVPVKRNYRTNIYGQLLTGNAGYEVEITPDFGGHNDVLVWDGKTVTEPKQDENGNYLISHPSELAWLAAAVNGTLPAAGTKAGEDETIAPNSYKGETFILTDDIDLQNHEWTPIGTGGKHFEGIFNGQGHTITGLRITERFGGDRFALFCSLAGSAQIKNVVIDNAYIKYPADGEDCYASAIAGTIYGDILFEGITIKNSTITGNNKVGAIFAHDGSSTKITINDCHVDNCYIASEDLKDGGCVGGLVGYFATGNEDKPNTISNSSVKNTTIVGINSSNNGKRANSLVIGSIKTKATMELNIVNCVLENNTFSQTIDGTAPVTYVGTFNPQYIGGDREEAHLGKITIDGCEVIANGVGMKDGEYYIQSVAGLKWLAEQVNGGNNFSKKVVKLATDLDLNNEEWAPIGTNSTPFNGTFDGQNFKIANLVITGSKSDVGLFGRTNDGEIKNLVVENAKVSGRFDVAVVAGNPYTTKYTNITVQGHVEVNGMAYVGGVGGKNAYANWTNITVNVDETSYVNANSIENGVAYRTYVGGVCGFNGEGGHSFTNITSNIDVKGSTIDVGGLFGIAHYGNKFENCSSSGDVEIYAAEDAVDAQEIGGIAGVWNNGGADVVFTNCSFTGTLKTNIADVDFYYGGLIGKPYSATGTGKLIIDGCEVIANGVGMKDGEYYIQSVAGLKWLAEQVNAGNKEYADANIVLNGDIDLAELAAMTRSSAVANNWTPIGTETQPFTGTFDGNGKTIKNLALVESEAKEGKAFIGFFGYAKDASIKNVTFENVYINIPCLDIDHSQGHIGAVAGSLEGTSTIENVTVKGDIKVEATQDANGASRVAVVAGGNSYGNVTMKNVHVIANEGSYLIANNNTGALAGQLQGKSVFENCSSNIDVTVNKFFAGGIIGLAAGDQKFTNCHTTGNIAVVAGREGRAHDQYRVGGIAGGWADNVKTPLVITDCSYTGNVSGKNSDGSVANPLDYMGYVGRGYTLAGCQGSKVVIDGVEFVQKHNTAAEAGIYDIANLKISSKADLLWFAQMVNSNKCTFANQTVKLGADIDLAGIDWEPIGQTGATTFNGVFDGQNYTISNLSVDSEDQTGAHYSSGLFGWVESHTAGHGHIKNVKINGATIKGHHNCGALVGYITQETALVENCHVTGATVSCTYANGDADGDKAGALIGNATVATPVKNCTAANSTVSSGRDAGQVIGAGREANVTGCSATEVTVAANGTGTGANIRNEVIGRLL